MFDRVEIEVKAGKGGDGAISFRREKFDPYGGPEGGDGGRGGNVVAIADSQITNLRRFKHKMVFKAEDGQKGRGKRQHGGNGKDLEIIVPVGTVILQKAVIGDEGIIADLEQAGQQVIVVRGGKGGLGNTHFTSSTNQAPKIAQGGELGEELSIILELRLIADVGIVGYPNVGKSSLLAAASAAKPEVAGYPFTTREPVLGVVQVGLYSFVLAEIPGLIDDAHLGRGLGHDFLRHILRTRVLIHLVDGSAESPVDDMIQVNNELGLFDSVLAQKPQIVAVNKIDLPQVQAHLAELRTAFKEAGTGALFVSALTGEGVPQLMAETFELLNRVAVKTAVSKTVPKKIFRPRPKVDSTSVYKDGDVFIVTVPGLDRLITGAGEASPEVRQQLKKRLARLGLNKVLEKAGVKPGDKIRCGNLELEW